MLRACNVMIPIKKQWIDYVGRQEVTDALITAVMDDGDGNLWIGTDERRSISVTIKTSNWCG